MFMLHINGHTYQGGTSDWFYFTARPLLCNESVWMIPGTADPAA